MTKWIVAVAVVTLFGCSKKPTAMDACRKIEASGVGAACKEDKPGGLGAAASEKAVFDLPSVPGKTGQVLRFEKEESYVTTEGSFEKAATLAGPHRYGSKKALIFVQANEGLSLEDGKKLKAAVGAL